MIDRSRHDVSHERLPIKLIMPRQGLERKVMGGGAAPKPFRVVDEQYRNRLSNQVKAITEALIPQLRDVISAPIRVKVISNAAAKSHRPDTLFSDRSCPIVGAGKFGELFIKATSSGLNELLYLIENNESALIIKELSCIETIEVVTSTFRKKNQESNYILRNSPRRKEGFITRVRLFDFGSLEDNASFQKDFLLKCAKHNIEVSSTGYSPKSMTFSAGCRTLSDIDALSRIVGIRSISPMPKMRTVRPHAIPNQELPNFTVRQEIDIDIPVVVVVDSGICSENKDLNSWVVGRESFVAPSYQNSKHGSFVAGLICWGKLLNPTIKGLDESPCGVFDLQVIPNYDPEYGEVEELLEQEFLISLESALEKYSNSYRVWNISLGTDEVCSLDEFSELAEELDNFQERFNVSFVISAGNYEASPLLSYPRIGNEIDLGRITSPADSVLAITVGSVSHVDLASKGSAENSPSPFSRHGAGPNHIIKPDVVHYGGACSVDGLNAHGVRSIIGNTLAEDSGTSFAAPLVSKTLAQIYHQITPTPSPVLARALLTHHSRDPRTGGRVPDGDENILGFGMPSPVPYCLECTPYSTTLVFDDVLRPGYYLEWDDFPFPASLKRDGKYFGEVWMTIAFSPSRGGRWGTEYCETHIDAHFGVYREQTNRDTGEIKQVFKGLVPAEHKNPGTLYESFQIEKLRKWAPVRTYHGKLNENGERGNRWRLKLQLLTRHEHDKNAPLKPQPFSLIITIADPEKIAPVYDDMAQLIRSRFQAENLAVRPRTQVRHEVDES